MVTSFHPMKWIAALGLLASSVVGFALAADVDAQLDRDSVQVGNGAQLTLRISGGRAGQPEIPQVENLIVQPQGQSQQTQWINGVTTVSVTYSYIIGSNTPGDYQIPAIEIMVDGKKNSTQPLKLKVLADAASQAPPGMPNPSGNPSTKQETTPSEDQFGFLTVEPATSDRKYVYVGEIAPVRIRAWIPAEARAQLRSGIQPEGKAFTLHHVSDQPQQTQEMKDGKRYLVVTWFGGISATKAGTYPASLSLQANVAVKDESAPAPRRSRGGPFDDPFFDSVFDRMNTRYIQKDVTLTSRDQEIEVRPLPSEGKPAGFTGAVGQFKLNATNIPAEWQTGDPQQVTASVSGAGNFALVKAPALMPEENWKTYQAKDEFTPGDQASFSGTKIFQFSAVPRKGDAQDVGLSFSYFDPTDAQYKTLASATKKIQVAGADLVETKKETTPEPPQEAKKPADNLIAQKSAETASGSFVPLVSQPAFYSWLGLASGLMMLGRFLAFFKQRFNDPKRQAHAALEKATRHALHTAGECLAAKDAAGFFAAARLAIQQRLGSLWNQPAQAITLAEISERIPANSPVTSFFREADLYEYSRHATAEEMFPRWRQMLDQALTSLNPPAR